jgi:hypothetical protein
MPTTPITAPVSEDAVYGKVAWRIIPLLFVCYIAAYLDRVNVSFAKLQMQSVRSANWLSEEEKQLLEQNLQAEEAHKDHLPLAEVFFIAMVGLTLATLGILATFPLFWTMPTAMLAGTVAAAGIAWINSLGNLAGFFGPSIVGWFTDMTKRSDYGLYVVAAALVLGSILVLGFVPRRFGADSASG